MCILSALVIEDRVNMTKTSVSSPLPECNDSHGDQGHDLDLTTCIGNYCMILSKHEVTIDCPEAVRTFLILLFYCSFIHMLHSYEIIAQDQNL